MNIFNFALLLISLSFFFGCTEQSSSNKNNVIRIAPLPDNNPETIRNIYQPLLEYLEKNTGIKTELVIPKTYDDLMRLFAERKIDMANFGGVTYLHAHKMYHAQPLIMRNVDEQFTSVILVRTNSSAKNLTDLNNKSFAFGSRLSTSGHFMPRHFFTKKNIQPETFFSSITYSGAHDKTVIMVKNGKVFAGVANSSIVKQMFKQGTIKNSDVRILWESPAYADYVWATQDTFRNDLKRKIQNAFLSLNNRDNEQNNILQKLGAEYYIPANHSQFSELEIIMSK